MIEFPKIIFSPPITFDELCAGCPEMAVAWDRDVPAAVWKKIPTYYGTVQMVTDGHGTGFIWYADILDPLGGRWEKYLV